MKIAHTSQAPARENNMGKEEKRTKKDTKGKKDKRERKDKKEKKDKKPSKKHKKNSKKKKGSSEKSVSYNESNKIHPDIAIGIGEVIGHALMKHSKVLDVLPSMTASLDSNQFVNIGAISDHSLRNSLTDLFQLLPLG